MTPKELAKHLAGRAHMCRISTSETHTLAAEAYTSAAKLIRQHLCAPNPLHDAAPDMLAALEEVMDWIGNYPPDFLSDDEWPDTQDRVDAAIAKARGE